MPKIQTKLPRLKKTREKWKDLRRRNTRRLPPFHLLLGLSQFVLRLSSPSSQFTLNTCRLPSESMYKMPSVITTIQILKWLFGFVPCLWRLGLSLIFVTRKSYRPSTLYQVSSFFVCQTSIACSGRSVCISPPIEAMTAIALSLWILDSVATSLDLLLILTYYRYIV